MRYLKRRFNVWWFQIAVPGDCRATVGKDKVYENLHTSDLAVAQVRALDRAAHHKARFLAIRGKDASLPSDAFSSGREWARAELLRIGREIGDKQERETRKALVYELAVEQVLIGHGLMSADELDEDAIPPEVGARLRGIRAAVMDLRETPDEYREPISRTAAAFLANKQRRGSSDRLTDQTVSQMEAVYRLYRDHTGDAPLRLSDKRTGAAFFDKLKRLDRDWGRSGGTKARTLDDLLLLSDREGRRPLSDRTLFRYRLALSQLWAWAKGRDEVAGDDPFEHLAKKGKNDENANAPWSDDAIKAYFAAHPDGSKKGKPDPFFWLPRIALLSGMRLNEICSLRVADLIDGDGVKCFDIKDGKTSAATRAVPIHDDLLPFLDVVPKDGYVFPDLIPGGKDKKRSAQIGKRLGRRFAATPGGSTFHAFRKNVAGTFERHRIPQSEAAQILGHGKQGITYKVYSPHGIPMAQRKALVDMLALPEGA
jgi:integrase